jgi:hypothetical protein
MEKGYSFAVCQRERRTGSSYAVLKRCARKNCGNHAPETSVTIPPAPERQTGTGKIIRGKMQGKRNNGALFAENGLYFPGKRAYDETRNRSRRGGGRTGG